MDFTFLEAFNKLELINEDLAPNTPPEVLELIKQGVPVFEEEPNFIEDEMKLDEAMRFIDLNGHYDDHVATGQQNLWELVNKRDTYSYKFSNLMNRVGGKDKYKSMAEDLASAEVDGTIVKAFICQDTRKEDDDHSPTKKYATGEARRNLNTSYRICKYRLNRDIVIPSYNMYFKNLISGQEGQKPTKDFVFADNNIYEVVYYSYSNFYGKYLD